MPSRQKSTPPPYRIHHLTDLGPDEYRFAVVHRQVPDSAIGATGRGGVAGFTTYKVAETFAALLNGEKPPAAKPRDRGWCTLDLHSGVYLQANDRDGNTQLVGWFHGREMAELLLPLLGREHRKAIAETAAELQAEFITSDLADLKDNPLAGALLAALRNIGYPEKHRKVYPTDVGDAAHLAARVLRHSGEVALG